MRLHNRQVKASFWTDTELIRELPRDGRFLYQGLWQLADDSGCIEDDVLAFKIHLFPADADITPEVLEEYKQALIRLKKLIPYEKDGKKCLFLRNFHKHQTLRSPAPPEVPLPRWVQWIPSEEKRRSGKYVVSSPDGIGTVTAGKPHGDRTVTVRNSNGDQPEPEPEPEVEAGSTPPPPSPTDVVEGAGEANNSGPDAYGPPAASAPANLEDVLSKHPRYTDEQRAVIRDYWDALRFTRRTARLSPNIVDREMSYWGRFPPDVVVEALSIHIRKCQGKREDYTRGIMRRLARERSMGHDSDGDSADGTDLGSGRGAAKRPTARDYTSGRYGAFFARDDDAAAGAGS